MELEQQNTNIEHDLNVQVRDARSLRNLLNASQFENRKLEAQLKAAWDNLVQQQVRCRPISWYLSHYWLANINGWLAG